jgi:hypothetical protein
VLPAKEFTKGSLNVPSKIPSFFGRPSILTSYHGDEGEEFDITSTVKMIYVAADYDADTSSNTLLVATNTLPVATTTDTINDNNNHTLPVASAPVAIIVNGELLQNEITEASEASTAITESSCVHAPVAQVRRQRLFG